MANLIACRVASYGPFQERAWSHLPELGIQHVEIPVPAPAERDAVRGRLADHGLRASSLQVNCDLSRPDAPQVIRPQLEVCAELGARICLLCPRAGGGEPEPIYKRLHEIGQIAAALGLVVALETHPDLVTNGAVADDTMTRVNHPAVRINFDTANIYYYNQGRSAVTELAKIIDHVVAVHLKDTTGGYQEWNFPALGMGIVDFPQVIQMLNATGFTGPFTIEVEGVQGVELAEADQLKLIADSVAYLREIGAFA